MISLWWSQPSNVSVDAARFQSSIAELVMMRIIPMHRDSRPTIYGMAPSRRSNRQNQCRFRSPLRIASSMSSVAHIATIYRWLFSNTGAIHQRPVHNATWLYRIRSTQMDHANRAEAHELGRLDWLPHNEVGSCLGDGQERVVYTSHLLHARFASVHFQKMSLRFAREPYNGGVDRGTAIRFTLRRTKQVTNIPMHRDSRPTTCWTATFPVRRSSRSTAIDIEPSRLRLHQESPRSAVHVRANKPSPTPNRHRCRRSGP